MTEETEKIFVIPLKRKGYASSKAAPTAMKRVKQYLMRHMSTSEDNIWIDESLNNEIWNRGKFNMPNKIRVKAVKFEDGVVEVYLPDLTFEKSRREILQEEKSKKQPILRKEEEEPEEEGEEGESGADEYEVVPAADGEVKIKKKKHPKEKEETEEGKEAEKEEVPPVKEKKETPKKQPKKEPSAKKEKTEKKPSEKKEGKTPSKKAEKKSS